MTEIELIYYPNVDTWIVEYEYGKTRAATEQEVTLWRKLTVLRLQLAAADARIEAMRNCSNCRYRHFGADNPRPLECGKCRNLSEWQPRTEGEAKG